VLLDTRTLRNYFGKTVWTLHVRLLLPPHALVHNYCTLHTDIIESVVLFVWGHALAQLVEALRYQLEGRGFDSLSGHRDFLLT
jgi:hypothetical protein